MNATERLEAMTSALASGRSLAEVSRETGIPLGDLEVWSTLYAAAQLEVRRRDARRRHQGFAAVALAVAGLVGGVAVAANGNCPNGMPFCFAADAPARATEVNHNFAQLKEWLERKVGPANSGNVTINGSLTVNGADGGVGTVSMNGDPQFGGNLTIDGGIYFGQRVRQMVNLYGTSYGIGVQSSTAYFRTGANFAWYQGGVHNDAALNAGGGSELMRLVPPGELITRGLRQVGNAAPVPYEVSASRLVVEATPSEVGSAVPINRTALENLCADVDGCPFTLSMVNWVGDGRAATRSGTLFLSETSDAWRLEVAGADVEGVDGDNSVTEYVAWDCYFGDTNVATNTSNGRLDTALGFGLLNCRGCAYSDTTTTCRLVIRD